MQGKTSNTLEISLEDLPGSALLSPDQTGAVLGIRPATLAVWRSTARVKLPYVKIGKNVKYRAGDLREFIATNRLIHTHDKAS